MTERNPKSDLHPMPEDVATLYSWANLHGAKYRDFSAARAQMREQARLRTEQAGEEEVPQSTQESALKAAHETAQELARHAANQASFEAAKLAVQQAQAELAAQRTQAAEATRQREQALRPSALTQISRYEERAATASPLAWPASESGEGASRPAWLMPERVEPAANMPALPAAPEDTLQGVRDRLASRWYALRSLNESPAPPAHAAQEAHPAAAQMPARAPVLAVFSLAGGVGKTSLVATLGRVLSAKNERVLLVDTTVFGLMPFFFGAREQRLGQMRTFSPPVASGDAPVQMIALDPESLDSDAAQDSLTAEIAKYARGSSRVIVDLATASTASIRRLLRLAPQVLVPLVPDMNSVVSVDAIDAFFEHLGSASGTAAQPYYLLNQFDASQPLHLDVREVLREQLGERLLPFVLRQSPAVSEALAEGMTVVDYAPNSPVAEDFANLASWVKHLSAPAGAGFRGVRWSER